MLLAILLCILFSIIWGSKHFLRQTFTWNLLPYTSPHWFHHWSHVLSSIFYLLSISVTVSLSFHILIDLLIELSISTHNRYISVSTEAVSSFFSLVDKIAYSSWFNLTCLECWSILVLYSAYILPCHQFIMFFFIEFFYLSLHVAAGIVASRIMASWNVHILILVPVSYLPW